MASDTRIRHERRFARVLSQVPNYDDQKFQARLSRKIERFFPDFTPNRFYDALNTLPSRAAELDQAG